MNDQPIALAPKRNIWLRGLLMILMALAYQLASTVLAFVALIQFLLAVISETPNLRLKSFGHCLGLYQGQIADFVSFASEDLPFPFSDWPSTGT